MKAIYWCVFLLMSFPLVASSQTGASQFDDFYFDRSFHIEDCYRKRSQNEQTLINCVTPPQADKCGVIGNQRSPELICGDVITLRRNLDGCDQGQQNPEDCDLGVLGMWKNDYERAHVFFGEIIQEPTSTDPLQLCFDDNWDGSTSVKKVITIHAVRINGSSDPEQCNRDLDHSDLPVPEYRREAICHKNDVITWTVRQVASCSNPEPTDARTKAVNVPPDDGQGTGSGTGF